MSFLSQFRAPKPASEVPRKARLQFPRGYTIADFRQNGALVLSMQKLLHDDALGGHLLAALYNGIPAGYPARGQAVNDTMAAIELGRVQGYLDCLVSLQSLAENIKVPLEIEQTYGEEQFREEMGIPTDETK